MDCAGESGGPGETQTVLARKLWKVETAECIRTYRGHIGQVHEVRFLPDGKRMVSCGEDRTVRVWDIESAKEIARGQTHLAGVRGLAVSADGRFAVTAGMDGGLRRRELPPAAGEK